MIRIISAKSAKRSIFQQFESANLWSQFPSKTLQFCGYFPCFMYHWLECRTKTSDVVGRTGTCVNVSAQRGGIFIDTRDAV